MRAALLAFVFSLLAVSLTVPSASAAGPAVTRSGPTVQQLQQIIRDTFAPLGPAAQQWALRVAKCESSYNPNAVNRYSGASGLFQFIPSTWASTPQAKAGKSVFDPVANAQAAAWLYKGAGPRPWVCK
jgi:soluble lytic murein transglycosylase-like protein